MLPQAFIQKWASIKANEIAVAQTHFMDVCDLVGHARPYDDPTTESDFRFEKSAEKNTGSKGRADAFYTCGSNRLFLLMKHLGATHGIPGQVAMEQIMACGLGPCYVCVRTFEINGHKTLKRVCIDGPVFDMQEAMGW